MEDTVEVKEEQVLQTATPTETETGKVFKTFNSEDDYNKEIQSAKSKAKYEVLQEFNAKDFSEIKTKLSGYDELKTKNEELSTNYQALAEERLFDKLGVKEELRAQFKASLSTVEGESTEAKAKVLLEKIPSFKNADKKDIAFGNDKNKNMFATDSELEKKYPWLKK